MQVKTRFWAYFGSRRMSKITWCKLLPKKFYDDIDSKLFGVLLLWCNVVNLVVLRIDIINTAMFRKWMEKINYIFDRCYCIFHILWENCFSWLHFSFCERYYGHRKHYFSSDLKAVCHIIQEFQKFCCGICSPRHHCSMHPCSLPSIQLCHTQCRQQLEQTWPLAVELALGCFQHLLHTPVQLCHLYSLRHLACTLQHQWHLPLLQQKDLALYHSCSKFFKTY